MSCFIYADYFELYVPGKLQGMLAGRMEPLGAVTQSAAAVLRKNGYSRAGGNLHYTPQEARHFYWHCSTAATLLETLELNTATRVHVGNAVRMATLNAAGKNGIRLASASAASVLASSPAGKNPKGLIREHVVPVSVILAQVMEAWSSRVKYTWRELAPNLQDEDLENWNVMGSDYFLDSAAPFSAVIARLVRDRTLLAWVTADDNARLRESGYGKSMPDHLPYDPRARYQACNIELVELQS